MAGGIVCLLMIAALTLMETTGWNQDSSPLASGTPYHQQTGQPRLIRMEPLPMPEGEICQWEPASSTNSYTGLFSQAQSPAEISRPEDADREPVRVIRDTYPTYSAVAVNLQTDEVFLQDENLFGIKVFDRTANTPPAAAFTEPKRAIAGGGVTKLEFNCGIYVDPKTCDIYSVTNDTIDTLTVFPWDASGEMAPQRELYTPHGTYGISVDEQAQEMYMTVQHVNSVVAYPKDAAGDDEPIRTIVGDQTQLNDPHGIAVDFNNQLLFVSNHGNGIQHSTNSGNFAPPSITIHDLQADGNAAPLRIIEGPRTQLNWPANMWVDGEKGELYVANDGEDSLLVFRITDNGNASPSRVVKGANTMISKPTGVFLDTKNDEVWVSNMGNHAATVYDRTANGHVAPKRIIRSAPLGKQAQAIGNPGAVAYDSKRDEILVPN